MLLWLQPIVALDSRNTSLYTVRVQAMTKVILFDLHQPVRNYFEDNLARPLRLRRVRDEIAHQTIIVR
jgi:hypothetical protein